MMISGEKAGNVTQEGKFFCAVCRKSDGNNSIQYCRYWAHKSYSGIRGTLKEDSKFKCQI